MRLLQILLILLLIPNTPAQNPVKGSSTVAGKVTLKREPAKGVTIGLFDKSVVERNPNSPGLRVKSRPDGTFRFTDVPAGIYYLTVFAPGYVVPGDATFWPVGRSKVVNVAEGETIDDLDLELKPGGVITGKVTDASGRPLVDTAVDLMNLDEKGMQIPIRSGWNPYLNMTDDRGIYRIYGLPAGKYVASVGYENNPGSITFTINRSYYPKTYHPDKAELEKARVLELREGDELTGVDIVVGEIRRTFDVTGRVVDEENSRPLAGIPISYGKYDSQAGRVTTWGGGETRTEADGVFKLNGVLPGSYAVFLESGQNLDYFADVRPFTVTDSDVEGVELRAVRGMAAAGRIVWEGPVDSAGGALSRRSIYALALNKDSAGPNLITSAEILPDMTFRLKGLRSGTHQIGISSSNSDSRIAVTRVEKDGALASENRIDISAGEQVRNLTVFVTVASGVIRGRIEIVGGVLPGGMILGAMAINVDQGAAGRIAEVDSRGNFVFRNLPPGDYEIRLRSLIPGMGSPPPEIKYIMDRISGVTERVRTGYGSEASVTMTVDLTVR